jgi:hypothetical protein
MTETTIDPSVQTSNFKFGFKKDKLGNKRATVEIVGLIPSKEGLLHIINSGGKALEFLQELVYDGIRTAIASDVSEDEKFDQNTYNAAELKVGDNTYPKYSFEGIANQPREDRRASSIPEEQWKGFAEDYIKVMPSVANKTVEQLQAAIYVYTRKFRDIKTDKTSLGKLKEQLALYLQHSQDAENYMDVLELLIKKCDEYLASNDVQKLIANL